MELLVLIIQGYNKGSGEPAHLLSHISAFAIHLHREYGIRLVCQNNWFAVPLSMHVLRQINAYEIITPISFLL